MIKRKQNIKPQNKNIISSKLISFYLLDHFDSIFDKIFPIWKNWILTQKSRSKINVFQFILDQVEQNINFITNTYDIDIFIAYYPKFFKCNNFFTSSQLKNLFLKKRENNIEKAIQLNNYFSGKATPSLLFFQTKHSFAFRDDFFILKILLIKLMLRQF
jgi:hypothetical protein